jgi:UDP-4-amino-4,6-dideoxy-N-acetyl-beta-L-altrosamine N-acetyltransferase
MIKFIKLSEEHLEQVLKWRTQENVTKYMLTDIEYNLDNQRRWFDKISKLTTEKYWMIEIEDRLVGVISLNNIDYTNRKTSCGFYIGEDNYRRLGGLVPPYLYNYVFKDLQLNKITAEVMEGNENVVKIHKFHGYREVGTYMDHIFKYGQYHDLYLMELLKLDWEKDSKRFKKYLGNFEE